MTYGLFNELRLFSTRLYIQSVNYLSFSDTISPMNQRRLTVLCDVHANYATFK